MTLFGECHKLGIHTLQVLLKIRQLLLGPVELGPERLLFVCEVFGHAITFVHAALIRRYLRAFLRHCQRDILESLTRTR